MNIVTDVLIDLLKQLKREGRVKDFIYQRASRANVDIKLRSLPTAVCFVLDRGEYDISKGRARVSADVNISFLEKQPRLDYDGRQNEHQLEPMQDVARAFMARLALSKYVIIENEKVVARSVYDAMDVNATGVNLQFRLTEVVGVKLACFEHHGDFFEYDDGCAILFNDAVKVLYTDKCGVYAQDGRRRIFKNGDIVEYDDTVEAQYDNDVEIKYNEQRSTIPSEI